VSSTTQGIFDTSPVVLLQRIDAALTVRPELLITAITLAELS